MKKVKNIVINERCYPDEIAIVNRLAELEERRPHSVVSRLIMSAGRDRIKKLEKQFVSQRNG